MPKTTWSNYGPVLVSQRSKSASGSHPCRVFSDSYDLMLGCHSIFRRFGNSQDIESLPSTTMRLAGLRTCCRCVSGKDTPGRTAGHDDCRYCACAACGHWQPVMRTFRRSLDSCDQSVAGMTTRATCVVPERRCTTAKLTANNSSSPIMAFVITSWEFLDDRQLGSQLLVCQSRVQSVGLRLQLP
jgi:hypothetical protein